MAASPNVEANTTRPDLPDLPDSLDAGFSAPVLSGALAAALSSLNFGWCLGEPNIHEDIIKDCVEGPQTDINGLPTCLPMSSTI
ncbi:hypothetical protein IWW54_003496, partial [Coemansia sp. RSA 2705]